MILSLFSKMNLFSINEVINMTVGKEDKDLYYNWNMKSAAFISTFNKEYAEELMNKREPKGKFNVYFTKQNLLLEKVKSVKAFNLKTEGNVIFDINNEPLLKIFSLNELEKYLPKLNSDDVGTVIIEDDKENLSESCLKEILNLSNVVVLTAKGEEIKV